MKTDKALERGEFLLIWITIILVLVISFVVVFSYSSKEPSQPKKLTISQKVLSSVTNPNSKEFLMAVIGVLVFAIVFLSITSWTLLRWRKRHPEGESFILIPEQMVDLLENLTRKSADTEKKLEMVKKEVGTDLIDLAQFNRKEIDQLKKDVHENISDLSNHLIKLGKITGSEINQFQKDVMGNFADLNEHTEKIRILAEERGQELERYKDGYDFSKNKSLILGIIRTVDDIEMNIEKIQENQAIEKEGKGKSEFDALDLAKDQLLILLEDWNVETYRPEIGSNLKQDQELASKCTVTQSVPAPGPDQVGIIQNIRHPGYKVFIKEGEEKIIRKAQVTVYRRENLTNE